MSTNPTTLADRLDTLRSDLEFRGYLDEDGITLLNEAVDSLEKIESLIVARLVDIDAASKDVEPVVVSVEWDYNPDPDLSYLEQGEYEGVHPSSITSLVIYSLDDNDNIVDSMGGVDIMDTEVTFTGTINSLSEAQSLRQSGLIGSYQYELTIEAFA